MMLREILMMDDPVSFLREVDADGRLGRVAPLVNALKMTPLAGVRHKDNLDHSLKVLGNAIAREMDGPDLVLRAAALLHDIGKPATRKKGGNKTVTFDGHEVVGARIVRDRLYREGFNREETEQVAQLVREHMRSHAFREDGDWTDSAVRRLLHDVNDADQMQRLVVIFYSDVTTRYDHKREAIHRQVDNLLEVMAKVRADDARAALRPAINGNEVMDYFGLTPGPELGRIMKFLNSDEGVHLNREDALVAVVQKFISPTS